jgi:RNA polymerase sigma factor (sigma-70 family)
MAATEAGSHAARALDQLYRRHGAEVYRYAYAMLGNRADAEDVTQTTFVNALRALERGESPRKPSNWLITIAHNIVRQRFRQAKARPFEVELHEELAGAEPVDDGAPTLAAVVEALGRIPPNQREALVLREFEGRPYAEIAEVLGITTSALETLLFRARRSLAEELEQVVTCQQAEQSISRSLDARLPRRERKRLEAHIRTCPACARFELVQKRSRRALRGLALVPIPLSLTLLKGTNSAAAASLPTIGTAAAVTATAGGGGAAAAGGLAGGALALKAAAVVAAVGVAGGVGYTGAKEIGGKGTGSPRSQQVRPTVPPGQAKGEGGVHRGWIVRATPAPQASARARGGRAASPSASAPGQLKQTDVTAPSQTRKSTPSAAAGTGNAHGRNIRAAVAPPGQSATKPEATVAKHKTTPPGQGKSRPERQARSAPNKQAEVGKKPTATPAKQTATPAKQTGKPLATQTAKDKPPAKPAANTPRAH